MSEAHCTHYLETHTSAHTQVLVYMSLLGSLDRDEDMVAAVLAQEVARVLPQHQVCKWGLVKSVRVGLAVVCMHANGSSDQGRRQA